MAYLNFLAAVAPDRVVAYRENRSLSLNSSLVIHVSHLLSYWISTQPVGKLLGQAIDEGEALAADMWHPLRPPKIHSIESVQSLALALASSWEDIARSSTVIQDDDFFRPQINSVVNLFRHAAEQRENVVSVLERPSDIERAKRIEIPKLD